MISAYALNAPGEITTGDIAGILGTIEPDSYGNIPIFDQIILVASLSGHLLRLQQCVSGGLVWLCRRHRLAYHEFLRAAYRSPCPYNYNDETSAYFVDVSGGLDAEYLNVTNSYGQSLSGPSGFTKWLFHQSIWLHCI